MPDSSDPSLMKTTRSTCPYCGVGCGVLIQSQGDQIVGVQGDPEHPANFGRLCTKGSTLHQTAVRSIALQTRAQVPQMRADRDSPLVATTWDTALERITDQFERVIKTHGPDAVAFYLSGQLLTEDYYVFNKLAKGLIGTNNLDTNSRLCMSSAVAGYKRTFGSDSVPTCYEDIDHAQCMFIVGSNTAWAHPIVFRRIEQAKKNNPNLRIIVADPRRTDTAQIADLFLPIEPGSDVALFHGMLHLLLWEDLVNTSYLEQHTEGFAALKATVREFHPQRVAQMCGIREQDLVQAARWFGQSDATLSMYCQGLNQSSAGTDKNAALINLHLATGQIGKPGAGPFSLTGQPNAMGGREVGGLANLMSAHRDMSKPEHREQVAALWGVPSVPGTPGKTAVEMFEAVRAGQIKALWIACTNPAQSLPDQKLIREALKTAELVIVQEAYATTATVQYADILLPATTWGEKNGTVTNSERRISRQIGSVPALGQARDDWRIAADVARRLQLRLQPSLPDLFPFQNAQDVWMEHRKLTAGTDIDITGLSWDILEQQGPQQWPYPAGATAGAKRLFTDGKFNTASGKAQFANVQWRDPAEKVDARFPLVLNTGRLRDQWHGMSRTGLVGQLFAHAPEPVVEMNSNDMTRRSLSDGDLVHVTSRRGSQVLPVQASDGVRSGHAFIGMHWGEEYVSGGAGDGSGGLGVNVLTQPAFDPMSKQPELKFAAIKVLKAQLAWRGVAFGWLPQEQVFLAAERIKPLLKGVAYGSVVPFGREQAGLLVRFADEQPNTELAHALEDVFGLTGMQALRYDDKKRGIARRMRIITNPQDKADVRLQAVMLTGDANAESWLREFLENGQSVSALGRALLTPSATAPAGFAPRGKVVCSCFGVAQNEISQCLASTTGTDEERLTALQGQLKCGTNCGSCVPELKRIIVQTPVQQPVPA